jgi:unsaturated rhamnogalacturonyl hydrolase
MNLSKNGLAQAINNVIRYMTRMKNPNHRIDIDPIDPVSFEAWEWTQGVGLYGLHKYAEITGDPALLAMLDGWYDRRAKEPAVVKNINTMAPLLTLACLCETKPDAARMALCEEWADWAMNELPRTTDGGFQHITTVDINEEQLWIDTLFMTVLFVAKHGVLTRQPALVEEAANQFLIHIKYLFARKTGLWHHGWCFIGRHNFAEAHWGRGNCWFTAAVVDFIEMASPPPATTAYLAATLRAQADALARHQTAGGMWRTLIDDPASYPETSGTAGFCYGILKGVRKGFLGKSYEALGLRALEAVFRNIDPDGCVNNVSYGTPMGATKEFYNKIPIQPMPYGQSLAILALTEGLRHV